MQLQNSTINEKDKKISRMIEKKMINKLNFGTNSSESNS
jgi:hypothetical protein